MSAAGAVRAVVFDCDGVLVDSEAPLAAIDQRMLADLGWQLTLQEVHDRFVGHTAEHFAHQVAQQLGELPAGWREPYEPLFHRALHEDLEPVPGVTELLSSFRWPIAVASNSRHARVRESLTRVGLLPHFDGRIVGSDDVGRGKPAPDVYLRAAALLAVPPAACVAVEDSVTGVHAALAAGMTVFGYADGLTVPGTLRDAGAVPFSTMADLPGLIEALERHP